MAYSIGFEPIALRQLNKLDRNIQARLRPKILALAENPRPHGVKKLRGYENTYRIRVGDYRIVYEIHDNVLWILIVEVGHRSDVYD
ncbi:MAG: type II toxin-antitoxin system RelE/ParE family toxin [Candidatus Parabeggiatoa sp. nov. 2]|nr:MAG: hypothetical protein B6247_08180 [Beggiatoa sp. 4572_84]RKZ55519.1 MAG: type II toxin-antitoxin system RelE/ParE family toxin [Gammaproteobacteria bacterium]